MSDGKKTTRKDVRSDLLRRRPDVMRYFGLAVTDKSVHVWTTHGALKHIVKTHSPVKSLIVSDLARGITFMSPESAEDFLIRWKRHYNDPAWDYKKALDKKTPPGVD